MKEPNEIPLEDSSEKNLGHPAYEVLVQSSQFPDKTWCYHSNHHHDNQLINTLEKAFRTAMTETQNILEYYPASDCKCQVTDLATGTSQSVSVSQRKV